MRRLLALGLGCLVSVTASSEDLLTIFDQAVVNDPQRFTRAGDIQSKTAVVTGLPADASPTPAPSGNADGPGLPERRAPVSAAPIEAHAAIPARPTTSSPRVAVPREHSAITENPVTREIRPPAPATLRPPAPVAAAPERVPAREAPSPRPPAREGQADTPDPSAIIDWLMKESPGRRPGG